jgi:AcrR family transcriptional regulator
MELRPQSDTETPAPGSHAGRPRSASADDAILKATAGLLLEGGYRALCMESVAARAGVSKATLYRRHKDKQALVTAMIAATVGIPPREHGLPPGTTRDGLAFMLRMASGAIADPSWLPILGAMLSEGPHDGGLGSVMRSQIFEPSGEIVGQLVEAGVARGELRPGVSADVVNDMLFGALLARSLLGEKITEDWLERLLAGVWDGIGASAPERVAEAAAATEAAATAPEAAAAAPEAVATEAAAARGYRATC